MLANEIRKDSNVLKTSIRIACLGFLASVVGSAAAEENRNINSAQSMQLSQVLNNIAISDDQSTIATAAGHSISTIHRATQSRKEWKDARSIVDLSVTATGQLLAVATGDTTINVYESRSGKLLQQIYRRDAPNYLHLTHRIIST